jgi:hypothetical protein
LLLGVAIPLALSLLPLGSTAEIVLLTLRWVVLYVVAVLGLAVVYRFCAGSTPVAMALDHPRGHSLHIAATLWLIGGALPANDWGEPRHAVLLRFPIFNALSCPQQSPLHGACSQCTEQAHVGRALAS